MSPVARARRELEQVALADIADRDSKPENVPRISADELARRVATRDAAIARITLTIVGDGGGGCAIVHQATCCDDPSACTCVPDLVLVRPGTIARA